MITELQKGMLLGYLANAPHEIKDIAASLMREETNKRKSEERLDMACECLDLSTRAVRGIQMNNIKTVRELIALSEGEFLFTPNVGRKALNEIKEKLAEIGLRFGMK